MRACQKSMEASRRINRQCGIYLYMLYIDKVYDKLMCIYICTHFLPQRASCWTCTSTPLLPISIQYPQLSRCQPVHGSVAIWLWLWLSFTLCRFGLAKRTSMVGAHAVEKLVAPRNLAWLNSALGEGTSVHGWRGPIDRGPTIHIPWAAGVPSKGVTGGKHWFKKTGLITTGKTYRAVRPGWAVTIHALENTEVALSKTCVLVFVRKNLQNVKKWDPCLIVEVSMDLQSLQKRKIGQHLWEAWPNGCHVAFYHPSVAFWVSSRNE